VEERARPAGPDDLEVVARLVEACAAELRPERGGALWADRESRALPPGPGLAADLADPAVRIVVGELDDLVVGTAVVRCEQLRTGARLAVVTDLYVEPDFRELGVGEAMLDEVVAWAEAQGCIGIDAVALPGMRETKNFFESFGLVARAIVVHRRLGPAEEGSGGVG
jgi:GNAT superfamily N-acetyltransferase